jgi:hypothetical protein
MGQKEQKNEWYDMRPVVVLYKHTQTSSAGGGEARDSYGSTFRITVEGMAITNLCQELR